MYSKPVKDHLGNEFKSIKEMCKYYDISYGAYISRLKCGRSLEKILTTPLKQKKLKTVTDHLGNKFKTEKEMCKHYGTSQSVYRYRLEQGWSVEKALTTPVEKLAYDHLGNEFKTVKEMCKYYNISTGTYHLRIRIGWSVEKALTTPVGNTVYDHLGNEYNSLNEMCKHYGISETQYGVRIRNGLSKEEALTTPVKQNKKPVCDHLGNKFPSISDMCKYHKIKKRFIYWKNKSRMVKRKGVDDICTRK